jgi:hypothetical protein
MDKKPPTMSLAVTVAIAVSSLTKSKRRKKKMIAKQTIRYILPMANPTEEAEARKFAEGVEAFYGWGGAQVRIFQESNCLVVEYDHFIETRDTVFGGK